MPALGGSLVGWPIMALFAEYEGQPYSEQSWHDGVVVQYINACSDDPYIVWYESGASDEQWESMSLPDVTVVYRGGCAGEVCVPITESIPGDDDLL